MMSTTTPLSSQYLFHLQTNIFFLKSTFEIMKSYSDRITIIVNKEKLEFHTIDSSLQYCTVASFKRNDFQKYAFNHQEPLRFALDCKLLYSIVKVINNDDIISLSVLKDDPNFLIFTSNGTPKIKDTSKDVPRSNTREIVLKQKVASKVPKYSDYDWSGAIKIQSSIVSKIIREIKSLGCTKVTIQKQKNYLTFNSYDGSEIKKYQQTIDLNTSDCAYFADELISGLFTLSYIENFLKTNRETYLDISLKNNSPLYLRSELIVGEIVNVIRCESQSGPTTLQILEDLM